MDTIYRIQNRAGEGPYNGQSIGPLSKMVEDHSWTSKETHPSPWDDGEEMASFMEDMYSEEGTHLFGFESLEQLHTWFTQKEMNLMEKHGFTLHEVKGHIKARSPHQVIFQAVE